MLQQRILTAIVLIILVLLGIFYLPVTWFGIITALVFLLAAWEWCRLINISALAYKLLFLVAVLVVCGLLGLAYGTIILSFGLLTWLLACYAVCHFDMFSRLWSRHRWFQVACGIWLLALAWYAINFIRWQPLGAWYLLLALLWVWGADIGAFFIGRRFGQHKLAPAISPGKSREGVWGGMAVVVLIAVIAGLFFPFGIAHYIGLVILSLVIGIISVVGDLFESMVKRQSGLKDSGAWLPGHGGLLDRLDSLISATPVFAGGLIILQHLI